MAHPIAEANMHVFLADLEARGLKELSFYEDDTAGMTLRDLREHTPFCVVSGRATDAVLMPNVPVPVDRETRFNPKDFSFPRLFVHGNSWEWRFAISTIEDRYFRRP